MDKHNLTAAKMDAAVSNEDLQSDNMDQPGSWFEHPDHDVKTSQGCIDMTTSRSAHTRRSCLRSNSLKLATQSVLILAFVIIFVTYLQSLLLAPVDISRHSTSPSPANLPDYLQTTATRWAGYTSTGAAPFLAETDPVNFPSVSFIPNSPVQTQEPVQGRPEGANVFRRMGELTPYAPSDGFGVDEYPLPRGANITWVNVISRHGARYPTSVYGAYDFSQRIEKVQGKVIFTDRLAVLNDWFYKLGDGMLVPLGRQELFQSGVTHFYSYGHLAPLREEKLVARTTTQNRMIESAEYFLAGFFGLGWTQNITLEFLTEDYFTTWNNTLAGWNNCPNFKTHRMAGLEAVAQWSNIYLADATARLAASAPGYDWTIQDSYDLQGLCAFETISLGYSAFCNLFTYDEWLGYDYSRDLYFNAEFGFASPVGRAIGIGYVQEFLARLQGHLITTPIAQVNVTLSGSEETFPLNQSLYFDFSHDANMVPVLVAFGFTQFAQPLPATHMPPDRSFVMAQIQPFAGRLDIEIIESTHPVPASRSSKIDEDSTSDGADGGPIKYIHFILNQRTIPLHSSFGECEYRDDGWCELDTWLATQKTKYDESMYDFACFGDYPVRKYGSYENGTPITKDRQA